MINFLKLKRVLLYILIGSLIVSSLVAVVAILIGQFNEITTKIFLTLFTVIIHSLVSLLFIWDDERQKTFNRLSFFINVIFFLIVISFITNVFGIWSIIAGSTFWNLYKMYFIIAFASLHVNILAKASHNEKYTDMVIYANYFFAFVVVAMLQPIIFINDSFQVLGGMYYRILGASSLIDGTLSILTIIFYKLYINKHPNVENVLPVSMQQQVAGEKKRGLSIWVWILIIYLLAQFILPLMFFASSMFYNPYR